MKRPYYENRYHRLVRGSEQDLINTIRDMQFQNDFLILIPELKPALSDLENAVFAKDSDEAKALLFDLVNHRKERTRNLITVIVMRGPRPGEEVGLKLTTTKPLSPEQSLPPADWFDLLQYAKATLEEINSTLFFYLLRAERVYSFVLVLFYLPDEPVPTVVASNTRLHGSPEPEIDWLRPAGPADHLVDG
jgi:hypothetical protein